MEQAHKDDNAVDSHHDDDEEHAPLSLDDLIDLLPTFLEECKKQQQLQQDLQRDDDQLLENVDESLTRTLADPVGSLLEYVLFNGWVDGLKNSGPKTKWTVNLTPLPC